MAAFVKENDISGPESEKFEIYSIFSILNGMHSYNVSATTGHFLGNEFGIDGGAIFVNGENLEAEEAFAEIPKIFNSDIHFIQSKTSSSFDYGEFAKFVDGVEGFVDGNMIGSSSDLEGLKSIYTELFKNANKFKENPKLILSFAFSGVANINEATKIKIEKFTKIMESKSLFSSVQINIIGASEMQSLYRRATESATAEFSFRDQHVLPDNGRVKESYIGYLPAAQLLNVITDNSSLIEERSINRQIFFDNVREYDPDSAINTRISMALRDEPQSFVFRNNGVTVVARECDRTGNEFTIRSFQVVNGCQTCNIIFENYSSELGEVHIPFRLIVSQDDDFINSIIVGTNNQNPVREEQFWALRPVLKQLEEYAKAQKPARALYLERRENQYRFESVPEKTRIIEPSALLKAVLSMFMGLPHRAGRDYREVKREFSDIVFLDEHDVRLYHAAAFAYYKVEFCYRTGRLDPSNKRLRMYYIWAIGQINEVNDDALGLKDNKARRTAERICDFCDDETKFLEFLNRVTLVIKNAMRLNSISLDQLRNESAADLIKKEILQILEN